MAPRKATGMPTHTQNERNGRKKRVRIPATKINPKAALLRSVVNLALMISDLSLQ
jgi:hypothetical protein